MIKNKALLLIVGIISQIFSTDLFADNFSLITKVGENRKSVQLKINNRKSEDTFCKQINLEVEYSHDEFNEIIGSSLISIENTYLLAGEEKTIYDLAVNQIEELNSEYTDVLVNRVKLVGQSCYQSNFADYCEYASKTEEETYTLKALMNEKKEYNCHELEEEIGTRLKLQKKNITDIKPITFLSRLEKLDLSENKIVLLDGIEKLTNLEILNVSKNPINDLTPALKLINIRSINASSTQVLSVNYRPLPKKLKKIDLRNTPFDSQKGGKKKWNYWLFYQYF